MSREETRELLRELKTDIRDYISTLDRKIDVATQNILTYAEKSAVQEEKILNLDKDVDSLGDKCRNLGNDVNKINLKVYGFSSGLAVLLFLLKFFIK